MVTKLPALACLNVCQSVTAPLFRYFIKDVFFFHSLHFFSCTCSFSCPSLFIICFSFLLLFSPFHPFLCFFPPDHPSLLHTRACFADTKRLSCFDPSEPFVASSSSWLSATQHGKRSTVKSSAFARTGFYSADGLGLKFMQLRFIL